MADLTVLETTRVACTSERCGGRTTRQHCIEVSTRGLPTNRHWMCTECFAKTPAVWPPAGGSTPAEASPNIGKA
jgi:hypothetical protein